MNNLKFENYIRIYKFYDVERGFGVGEVINFVEVSTNDFIIKEYNSFFNEQSNTIYTYIPNAKLERIINPSNYKENGWDFINEQSLIHFKTIYEKEIQKKQALLNIIDVLLKQ